MLAVFADLRLPCPHGRYERHAIWPHGDSHTSGDSVSVWWCEGGVSATIEEPAPLLLCDLTSDEMVAELIKRGDMYPDTLRMVPSGVTAEEE